MNTVQIIVLLFAIAFIQLLYNIAWKVVEICLTMKAREKQLDALILTISKKIKNLALKSDSHRGTVTEMENKKNDLL